MKKCSKCLLIKEFSDFNSRKNSKDGHRADCKRCLRIVKKIYRQSNVEKIKIKKQIDYIKNSKKIKARVKDFKINNPEKLKIYRKTYNIKNKGIRNAHSAFRRTNRKNATPRWLSKFDLDYIKSLYIQAKELEKLDGIKYHVDHIIPIKSDLICGLHVPWNLQILTEKENIVKSNKLEF